jgi:hypothetical protein
MWTTLRAWEYGSSILSISPTNAARLHTRNNPGFFKVTVIEQAVADELGLKRASPVATALMEIGSFS